MFLKFIRFAKFCALICAFFFALFLILDFLYPLNLAGLNREKSLVLYSSEGEILNMQISSDEIWRFHSASSEIPTRLKQSVVHFEDRYFYYHFGINPVSIVRAFVYNTAQNFTQKNRNIERIGASTITMQVARMMNPKKRTYANKLIEIFNAFQLEFHHSKDEILTMYLNLAPYGGNIEGVGTASYFYFGRSLSELSSAQIALLSIVPKNPNKNRLDLPNRGANSLKNRLVRSLYEAGILDKSEYERAKAENFTPRRYPAPNFAPHYALRAFNSAKTQTHGANLIHSNLNKKYQLALENFLSTQVKSLGKFNVKNGAAVLIDNEKMAVVAYVGSQDFAGFLGQNDGVKSLKNVGSTLKPFIYARALEEGLITPLRQLLDAPISFAHYVPQNYNRAFMGLVSATDALGLSLNIPAVKLSLSLGDNGLYELLNAANLAPYDKAYYGLGLALGGVSISLIDLTHLFSVFANGGELKPLEVAGRKIDKNVALLRPDSAYIVTEMLRNAPRTYLGSVWQNTTNMPPIMFKTGTSADGRDLYTIGVSPKFSLGVWLGNFSGAKTTDLSGGVSAARVVFDMFSFLSDTNELGNTKFSAPSGVRTSEICADFYRESECKNVVKDLIIDDVSLRDECEIYATSELFYLLKNKILDTNATLNGRCAQKFSQIKPSFNDINDKIFEVGDEGILRLSVQCVAVFGDEIFLSINGGDYEARKNGENFVLELGAGEYALSCLDENANFTNAKFSVKSR